MAHGYPDNFGQSVWPKYGEPVFITGAALIPFGGSGGDTYLGNGVLVGLRIRLTSISILDTCNIVVEINGQPLIYDLASTFFSIGGDGAGKSLIECSYYDSSKLSFECFLRRELPFYNDMFIGAGNDVSDGVSDMSLYYTGVFYRII
jgi:hypothetical protein